MSDWIFKTHLCAACKIHLKYEDMEKLEVKDGEIYTTPLKKKATVL